MCQLTKMAVASLNTSHVNSNTKIPPPRHQIDRARFLKKKRSNNFRFRRRRLTTGSEISVNFCRNSCQFLQKFLPISAEIPANFYRNSCQFLQKFLSISVRNSCQFLQKFLSISVRNSCQFLQKFLPISAEIPANLCRNSSANFCRNS